MFSFSGMVSANSGPVYWQGYPSSEIMSVARNSPITVQEENLLFDFSDYNDSDYSISGKITAVYKMVNPTNGPQSVQMAFPFVGALEGLSPDSVVVTAGDSVLPYDLYIGEAVNAHGTPGQKEKGTSFDFAGIVEAVTNELYRAKNFADNEKGRLYIFDVTPTADQRINFAVEFNLDDKKTKVFAQGFNRYERDGEKTKIAAGCYEPQTLEIMVLGEDIDFRTDAYSDGALQEKTGLFSSQISVREVTLKQYLLEYVKKNAHKENEGMISDTQLYNLYAKSLDQYFTENMGFCFEHDLLAQGHHKRILTLVYTVEFPPDGEKEVGVNCRISGTMDKTKTVSPLYSFDYMLNPAENWSDFENLNIKIITPPEAPYIVESSIKLAQEENRVYTAILADLPADDLSFALYAKEKITLMDKVAGSLRNSFGYFIFFLPFVTVFFIIVMIIFIRVNSAYKKL